MSIKKDIVTRITVVYILFALLGVGIFVKIIYIQFVEGSKLREKAKAITYRDIIVEPNRGDILASDGRVLATSVPYYDIRMDLAASGLSDQVFFSILILWLFAYPDFLVIVQNTHIVRSWLTLASMPITSDSTQLPRAG